MYFIGLIIGTNLLLYFQIDLCTEATNTLVTTEPEGISV